MMPWVLRLFYGWDERDVFARAFSRREVNWFKKIKTGGPDSG